MSNFEVYEIVNIFGFILGTLFGIVAQKNQFCFSGSIKDYILTKSTKRASSVVMAMLVAVVATYFVSSIYELDLTSTNYHKQNANYFTIILGGLLFGAGMMLADGCSNRHLIKFGQGDSKSLITLIFIAIFAYGTTKGLLYGYLSPIINSETLIKASSLLGNFEMNIFVVVAVLVIILFTLTRSIKRIFTISDGFFIGLIIAAAWYVTGVIGSESMERMINLSGVTFVYPTAQSLEMFMFYEVNELTFPICVVCGVIFGTFIMSKINKKYSFGCTSNNQVSRVKYNMIGGAMMGTGGILSIGCTVGQGLTGLSTLAFATFIAISSIFISALITAIILNKYGKLPMCFIFEWNDTPPEYNI